MATDESQWRLYVQGIGIEATRTFFFVQIVDGRGLNRNPSLDIAFKQAAGSGVDCVLSAER